MAEIVSFKVVGKIPSDARRPKLSMLTKGEYEGKVQGEGFLLVQFPAHEEDVVLTRQEVWEWWQTGLIVFAVDRSEIPAFLSGRRVHEPLWEQPSNELQNPFATDIIFRKSAWGR